MMTMLAKMTATASATPPTKMLSVEVTPSVNIAADVRKALSKSMIGVGSGGGGCVMAWSFAWGLQGESV